MILVETVLGSRLEPGLAERLHELEHRGRVDVLSLPSEELARRRFKARSRDGEEIAVALPRDQKLFDGAVLHLDGERALVVRVDKSHWLRLSPRCVADAVELGYHAGNLHWRVRFEGEALLVALEGPAEHYLNRLGGLVAEGRVGSIIVEDNYMRALVAALWQSDAAFPSGGFAFSGGVEAAAAAGPLDASGLGALIEVALTRRWALSERPALWRALRATDLAALAQVDAALEAATLCEPFRAGSRRNGRAFLTAHRRLQTEGGAELEAAIGQGRLLGHLAGVQGWIWRALGLGPAEAAAASAYLVAAGMANAAVRLGALGALEAQRALASVLPRIEELAAAPFDAEAPLELSSSAMWLDVVTARHARAHLRLFAN